MSSLSVKDLQFGYPGSPSPQVDGITFDVPAGEVFMVVGDNGSGKTTLGKLLTGVILPQAGDVLVDGQRVHHTPVAQRPRHAIYMGQTSYLQFFRPSIAEEISLARKFVGGPDEDLDTAYQSFHLPPDRNLKPMDLAYPEMWRLQLLLMAVIFKPSVLFIDELVAPSASFQRDALKYVLQSRTAAGQITIVAYQRPVRWLAARTFALRQGKLTDL